MALAKAASGAETDSLYKEAADGGELLAGGGSGGRLRCGAPCRARVAIASALVLLLLALTVLGVNDEPSALEAVVAFYAAVDSKAFAALREATGPGYEATFAPGCATVGGATHCGEESFGLEQLIALLSEFPPANNPWAGGRIARELAVDGNSVINHYTKAGAHGAAVHHVENGRVVASFWYGGAESTARSPAAAGGSCRDAWATAEGVPRELGGRIPVIFDSDFGSYMDDSFALSFALGSPEISVELAIAVGGPDDNPLRRARCLGRHLAMAGRGHIPVASGPPAAGPQIGSLRDWGDSYLLESHPGGYSSDAAAAAAAVVRRHAATGRQVVWVILGAHTAAADFARRFPGLVQHVRVVAMGVSLCGGVTMPWGREAPWPATNERQNTAAANAVIRAPWGGGPVLFAPVKASSFIVLSGEDYSEVLAASRDAERSPGLATLMDAYEAWWVHAMSRRNAEAATVNPQNVSVEIFDALAVYLAFSSRGLTTYSVTTTFRADGFAPLLPEDADMLPCNTSRVPRLQDRADGVSIGVAVDWQPGQLDRFNREMTSRFIAGGRPCRTDDDVGAASSCTIRARANCAKNDLNLSKQFAAATVADCCDACAANPRCDAFTVDSRKAVPGKAVGACYLKANCSGLWPDPLSISGMKDGRPFPYGHRVFTNCKEATFPGMCEAFDDPGACHWCGSATAGSCLPNRTACPAVNSSVGDEASADATDAVDVASESDDAEFGLSVRAAGASGDNSTSDSAAFESAVAGRTAGAARLIQAPAGLYRLTRTLQLQHSRGGLTLAGEAPGSTILLWGGNDSAVIDASSQGTGHVVIRDLSLHPLDLLRARLSGRRPGQHGIILGPVQAVVALERIEVFAMGDDGVHHRGNSALVSLHASDLHSNWGWGVRATAESGGAAQNLVITANSIYSNVQGGVSIEASEGCSVRDNDIEGGVSPRQPLLLLRGNQVYASGNTLGLAPGDGASAAAVFEGSNIVSVGGSFTINSPNQTALVVACRDGPSSGCPSGVSVQGAVFAAPGGGGGMGLEIGVGVEGMVLLSPSWANGFAARVLDRGTGTVYIPPLMNASV